MSNTQAAAKLMLDKETDARFWAQTNYKPGQKLDMGNSTDRAMGKVWADIYAKVAAEDRVGKLVLTYNHPAVEQHLDNAATASAAAAAHVGAAVEASNAGDDAKAAEHLEHASKASQVAGHSSAAAAAQQPPSVSPAVADAAAHEAAAHAGMVPPAPIAPRIPKGHPAGRGGALPSHPHLTAPIHPPDGVPLHPFGGGGPTVTVHDHMALNQAMNAPGVAVVVHENASRMGAPVSTVAPGQRAAVQAMASTQAQGAGGDFVGTIMGPAGTWEVTTFPTLEALSRWFGDLTDMKPTPFCYLAMFDRSNSAGPFWPAPLNEVFGDGGALLVAVPADRPEPPERVITQREAVETLREVEKPNNGPAIAAGAVAITAIFAAFAARRKHKL